MKDLSWGILGTGNIARQFVEGLRTSRRSGAVAVGSRGSETGRQFAQTYGIERAYGSYGDLLKDARVDAVYNSLPNSLHHEWTIKALEAGKHVLCEKPLALDAKQSREMFEASRSHGRVLVEAFMYRSHPLTHAVIEAVKSGEIGELELIRTSFCYRTTRPNNIRFDRSLGGGGLMDIGCYCINFSNLFAEAKVEKVSASAHFHSSGVDDVLAAEMRFANGVIASFTCGMSVHADNSAYLCGTEGYIVVPVPWKPPAREAAFTIARSTPPRMDNPQGAARPAWEQRTVDAAIDLYALEADDFAATVLDGKPPAVSETQTLANMAVLDEMRRQIGLRF